MLFFRERKKLADVYLQWVKDNNILDCPLSVITFLHIKGLLNEAAAFDYLKQSERGKLENENET